MSLEERKDVVLDLDDTLCNTSSQFARVRLVCTLVVFDHLGYQPPHGMEILQRQDGVDLELLKRSGDYRVERFARSWVETYRLFCHEIGLRPESSVEERLTETAIAADRPPFSLLPGALEAVRELSGAGFTLHVVTIGHDQKNQLLKVTSTGLDEFIPVDSVHFARQDKGQVLGQLLDRREPECMVMVGNSMRHDILPARRLGLHAIHVPCRCGWSADDQVEELPSGRRTVLSISEVPGVIRTMF